MHARSTDLPTPATDLLHLLDPTPLHPWLLVATRTEAELDAGDARGIGTVLAAIALILLGLLTANLVARARRRARGGDAAGHEGVRRS